MLSIKKRSFCQVLNLYIIIMSLALNFLQDFLRFPSLIKYTLDLALVVVLVCMIFEQKQFIIHKKIAPVVAFIAAYIVYVSIVYLFKYQSIFYFLWGIRNNLRYYIAFMAFVYFFDKDDVELCTKLIDVTFALHIVVTFFQFFVLGYKQDYLGGIFGVQLGCNGNSMMLMLIVCIKSLIMYMYGKETLAATIARCALSLVVAAMAELKFFFVLFLLILIGAAMITKFSWKKVSIIASAALAVFIAGSIFTAIWGEDAALSLERVIKLITATSYSSSIDLGRFTAIPAISDTIMTDTWQRLFGLGLGNCDTSAFEICNTPFYRTHSYLNYNWFSSAFSFIETGYFGVLFSLSFFAIIFICAMQLKKKHNSNAEHCDIAAISAATCVALFFYNSSLRTDIAYIFFFVLALPFVFESSESVRQKRAV